MRSCIMKLQSLYSQKKNSQNCKRACVAALLSLYKVNQEMFTSQVLLLPLSEQIIVKNVINKKIPTFSEELQMMSKRKKSQRRNRDEFYERNREEVYERNREEIYERNREEDVYEKDEMYKIIEEEEKKMDSNAKILL